jgi:hypothetical protein
MHEDNIDRVWMIAGIGAVQLVMGLIGAMNTALIGRNGSLLVMNRMHGTAHAVAGVIAIAIGFALTGRARATATIAYGVLFLIGFAVNLASPDLWRMMSDAPANMGIHVMHLTFAGLTLAAGLLARAAPARLPVLR